MSELDKLWAKVREVQEGRITLDDPDIISIEYLEPVVDIQKILNEIELNKKVDMIRNRYEDSVSVDEYAGRVKLVEKRQKVRSRFRKRVSDAELKAQFDDFQF